MAEGFVMALSGKEIRKDILSQIDKKLQTDCNLRDIDAYSGGYSGTIKIENLRLFGVNTEQIDMEIPVSGQAQEGDDPVGEEVVVNDEIKIEREQNLDEVRDRSGQGKPIPVTDEKTGETKIKTRTYARPRTVGAAVEE